MSQRHGFLIGTFEYQGAVELLGISLDAADARAFAEEQLRRLAHAPKWFANPLPNLSWRFAPLAHAGPRATCLWGLRWDPYTPEGDFDRYVVIERVPVAPRAPAESG